MRLNTSWFAVTLMAALLILGTSAVVAAPQGEGEGEGEMASLTGCLIETDEGGYVLEEQESGDEIALDGEALADHVGHTVTVTGDWAENEDGMEYFAVDSLEHLSASCEE